MQLNRRYIRGFQFAVAYTYARALGVADDDEQQVSAVRPLREWHYAPLAGTQTHNLVINYTWDLPKASKLVGGNRVVKFLFDDWQLSGENAFASGDWTPVFFTTTNNFDFTGGSGGTGADVGPGTARRARGAADRGRQPEGRRRRRTRAGRVDRRRGLRAADGPRTTSATPRATSSADRGSTTGTCRSSRTSRSGRRARAQFRVEAYNVLNHTQFGGATVNSATGGQGIDNTLRFDAAGNQINANFGKATAARNARILQGSIRFSF